MDFTDCSGPLFVPQLLLLSVFDFTKITAVLVSYILTPITITVTFIRESKLDQSKSSIQ